MSERLSVDYAAPWHRASFVWLVSEGLPKLLKERLPLTGYHATWSNDQTVVLHVGVADAAAEYVLPAPDRVGLFHRHGDQWVVVPVAEHPELNRARIACVGEQFLDYVSDCLGKAGPELAWDAGVLRALLPLDAWMRSFLQERAQRLDTTNWLSRHTHLRRLLVAGDVTDSGPRHAGRVCPIETPEGPNCGRVVTIALGARVEGGLLIPAASAGVMGLGPAAAMIPFLEHSDPARTLMGANMMRQWLMPAEPEVALVQSGAEPGSRDFWSGCNLLTAFTSWAGDTVDDGIVVSASAARRLGHGCALEPGDKLANRHGTKGVVSRVLPDDDMPHLADGTPVDLVFSFIGLHTRLNVGQLREAVAGRIARAEGRPFVASPLQAPDDCSLRLCLRRLGLAENGMERLRAGRTGTWLEWPTTVGWVYWGCTHHLARHKLHTSSDGRQGQMQGELEFAAMRAAGAYELISEQLGIGSAAHPEALTLAAKVSRGEAVQAGGITPIFRDLQRRLAAAGIRALLSDGGLAFQFAEPAAGHESQVIRLAASVAHPWIPERQLAALGVVPGVAYDDLRRANERLARLVESGVPASLMQEARLELARRVSEVCDALVGPLHLQYQSRLVFSGRAVAAPGPDLDVDQVGLPETMAKALFRPWVDQELASPLRTAGTEHPTDDTVLDAVLRRHWVVVNRAPSLTPTALVALRPLRVDGSAVRIHPLICQWLQADFDGDQVAVFLPVTEGGQRDAAQHLSVTGHLERDPGLLDELVPRNEAMWGLAWLSRTAAGREEINALVGTQVLAPLGYVTRGTLTAACREVYLREGPGRLPAALAHLMQRGLQVAKAQGASLPPLVSWAGVLQSAGGGPAREGWDAVMVEEYLASLPLVPGNPLVSQLLAVKSMARGSLPQLAMLLTGGRAVPGPGGEEVTVEHGYAAGLAYHELQAVAASTWRRFRELHDEWEHLGQTMHKRAQPQGYSVLIRAMRAQRPGVVFARAAAAGESDPLADTDSRLFVGRVCD